MITTRFSQGPAHVCICSSHGILILAKRLTRKTFSKLVTFLGDVYLNFRLTLSHLIWSVFRGSTYASIPMLDSSHTHRSNSGFICSQCNIHTLDKKSVVRPYLQDLLTNGNLMSCQICGTFTLSCQSHASDHYPPRFTHGSMEPSCTRPGGHWV